MATYRDLVAWQKAMQLVVLVYECTKRFPREEAYGLSKQLRRAAVSVPSNIAEGQARHSHAEFHRYLITARGSLAEIETQLLIARELGYVDAATSNDLLQKAAELGRILNGLREKVRSQIKPGHPYDA